MADRSYYRLAEDARLIEEAKYNPNRELAIALGERLDDVLATAEIDINDSMEKAADLRRERDNLKCDLEEALDTIEDLKIRIEELEKEQDA